MGTPNDEEIIRMHEEEKCKLRNACKEEQVRYIDDSEIENDEVKLE